jgi:hypothetical protein
MKSRVEFRKLSLPFSRRVINYQSLPKHVHLLRRITSESQFWSQTRNYQAIYLCSIGVGSVWFASVISCDTSVNRVCVCVVCDPQRLSECLRQCCGVFSANSVHQPKTSNQGPWQEELRTKCIVKPKTVPCGTFSV